MSLTNAANRYAKPIRWASALAILVSVILLARALPVDRAITWIRTWIDGLGFWGPAVFALIYIVAVVLFVPASALTLAAGALFGPVWGTICVSAGSTIGAACAFLIARYVARARVVRLAGRSPRFAAIDGAIGRSGWRIVALLRLTPLMPFNVLNYLLGVTPVRFGHYVLASWVCMMPATFLYVYLGYVGGAGLAAATGAAESTGVWVWVARGVGLAATVAVTLYITRLAFRALKSTELQEIPEQEAPGEPLDRKPLPPGWPWKTTAIASVAVMMLAGALGVTLLGGSLGGPPPVTSAEAYDDDPASPRFDHSALNDLLARHVDGEGRVDYGGLSADSAKLDAYLDAVAAAPFEAMGRNQKLALLINAYNAFTLRLILDHAPVASIKDIPSEKRWSDKRWTLGGHTWSLDQIEHEQIRPNFREPRIHFALVCAAVGCPPLRNEAYDADRLDRQLDEQARYVHTHDRWFRLEPDGGTVHLTKLYDWYGGDFTQAAGSVLAFAARYSEPLAQALEAGRDPSIRWLDYDWDLNGTWNSN